MSTEFQVLGQNSAALFTLKLHRGDGMLLLAMNWKQGKPPLDFVGFAIEYKEPGGSQFYVLKNRLTFAPAKKGANQTALSSRLSPIQKFRWVHFPRNANLEGAFVYRVTPVFMNDKDELSYGEHQEASIELRRETYPGLLNVAFTRGFIASQAFVDRYGIDAVPKLLPGDKSDPLTFKSPIPKAEEAYSWMGFEARSALIEVLDQAIADKSAQVCAAVYDLNAPEIFSRYQKLGPRLRIIIDDSDNHADADSAESRAAELLRKSAGAEQVRRQHLGNLQHNKIIVVKGNEAKFAVCGSTNHSYRGLFVQNNNVLTLRGEAAVEVFQQAFEHYWGTENNKVADFAATSSAIWNDLGLDGIDAKACFSPHSKKNAVLDSIAQDIQGTESSLFFSLAFLYLSPGKILKSVQKIQKDKKVFSYGISDHQVKGLSEEEGSEINLHKPNGSVTVVRPSALSGKVPEPFKSEPAGGGGCRMHHKFVVIDFDKPTARVYLGSYNFSEAADTSNGENLVVIRDRRVAVSYAIEALRIFDHYHFRVAQQNAKTKRTALGLAKPPRKKGEAPWWTEYYKDARKIRDRELFA